MCCEEKMMTFSHLPPPQKKYSPPIKQSNSQDSANANGRELLQEVKMEEPKALSEKIALSIDLTKELEVKRCLENAKKSLQVIFDSLEDGISVIDRKYEIIRVNKAILNIFGKRDFSEILGKKCGSFSK